MTNEEGRTLLGFLGGIVIALISLIGVWLKSHEDRGASTGSTLATAEQKFRDDLQETLERQSAQIAALQKDNQANYEQIAELAKKNTHLEIETINKDEKITQQAQKIAVLQQDAILLREELVALQAQMAELKARLEAAEGDGK